MVGSLGSAFGIAALRTIGQVSRFLLPTDGLWHGVIFYLEPPSLLSSDLARSRSGNPFLALGSPTWGYLLWVGVWLVVVLAAAVLSFQRREL